MKAWPPLIPFDHQTPPTFPIQALPTVLADFASAVASSSQTPDDMAATLCLTVLAAACGGRLVVQAGPDYTEPTNLFTLCALAPGNRKSATLRQTTQPLEDFEQQQCQELAPDIARQKQELAFLHKQKQAAEKRMLSERDATKAAQWADKAKSIAAELALRPEPHIPRLLADDATPERLVALLAENEGRLAVLSSEATLLEIVAGRYSNGTPVLEALLKGHAGDTLRVDRVGRPSEFIPQPALTIGLTTQPAQLRGLLAKPQFRTRGLLARFLYTLPPSPMGSRDVDPPPIPPALRQKYHQLVTQLISMPAVQGGAAHVIQLSSQARQAWLDFARAIEPRLAPKGDLNPIADWAGKLCGAVLRIAGLLHAAMHPHNPWETDIEATTLTRAILIATYYLEHAKAAFALMAADPKVEDAQHVLRWLERQQLECFSLRDCFNALRGRFNTAHDLSVTLDLLNQHGFLRQRPQLKRTGPGRKPSPLYELNPKT